MPALTLSAPKVVNMSALRLSPVFLLARHVMGLCDSQIDIVHHSRHGDASR